MGALRKVLLAPLVLVPTLLVLALAAYAALGFWGVPWLVRSQATKYVQEKHDELRLGEVTFNPFTFKLTLRDAMVVERGKPLVGVRYFLADYQAVSLFKGMHVLREVTLDRPYARTVLEADGSLNLAKLLPKTDPNEPWPKVLVEDLTIGGGRVDFTDRRTKRAPTKSFSPIAFNLKQFRTTAEGGNAQLQARSQDGEALSWQGHVSLTPVASTGRFTLAGLQAKTIEDFVGDLLPFRLPAGRVELGGDYTFSLPKQGGMQLDAHLPKIGVRDLRLRAQGVDEDWVVIPSATVTDTRLSLARREIRIGALRADGVQVEAWMEPNGDISLFRLFTGQVIEEAKQAPGGEWSVEVAQARIEGADIRFEDRTVKPAAKFDLSRLVATAGGVSFDMKRGIPITVTATVNDKAPLTLEGTVVPDPFSADLHVDVSALPMRGLLAYLPDYPALDLRSGEVGAKGHVVLRPAEAPGPELEYQGDASIARFDLVEKASGRPFLAWARVDVGGIDYAASPDRIAIRTITVKQPVARVEISPSGKLNLTTTTNMVAATPGTSQAHATGRKTASMLPPLKVGEVKLDDGTLQFADFSIQPNFQAKIDALRGRIGNISTAPGTISQVDLSGHVINRYSPVTIKGSANLLVYDERTHMAMQFRNIELPIFNPYSGKWAGYAIAKGKLTTELDYKIDHRRLVAQHHVVIDQLKWGEATDSKEKVSLPVRLATSLLKDSNGTITLDVPVTGTLDDPKFRLWPIIWQIVKNIVVKIVSAPFKLLASLFQGAEDAQYVDFAPGSSTLPDKAKGALPKLADSLAARPELRLDIPAGPVSATDKAALDDQAFQAAVAEFRTGRRGADTPYAELEDKDKINVLEDLYRREFGKRPEVPDAATMQSQKDERSQLAGQLQNDIALNDAAKEEVVLDAPASSAVPTTLPPPATTGAAALASAPPSPATVASAAQAKVEPGKPSRHERKAARRNSEVEWLEAQLRPRFRANATAADQLAKTRASEVQDALLSSGKVDPTRVFVDTTKTTQEKDDKIRMELALE
ncbi:DUF748 domain-containing protein [Lysobacter sp. KIS68-7]|uniref:DUF748 domain-containing protein n=1 Tax=Lysobacter sp. KIS68-7 TaxID=2904252 RepID=UPI001E5AB6E9|nr:DUF748 domain-containing protein [Lysobacter sp. KIS68-7]UHQ18210.1 DUF748 domain-containing protein [Lysobacter sp. KIS68-7]